ncbi:beta-2 adrenergic receptor-like protein [Dinothrombium tinctorium]|uniref:Beta-2 adrenergic receptor-like protein n=1 Tax=Dinothrombium tinctorium TaxID=1965070 RepID=A0A443RAP5_9ACAR|nr:beta-2 adrenergic receptor-like protein [Dinothrombium tinctorium]
MEFEENYIANYDFNESDASLDSMQIRINLNSSETIDLNAIYNESDYKWWLKFFPDNEQSKNVTLFDFALRAFGIFIATLIICSTVFGNTLVIIVVRKFHKMKTVTNILLARYWAITNPLRYKASVNKRRIFCTIASIWLCSITISFVPVYCGWFHDGSFQDIYSVDQVPDCGLKVNLTYAIISSSISFYLPLHIMLYVYFQILIIAERQSREIRQLEMSFKQNGFIEGQHSIALSDSTNNSIEDKKRVERNLKKRAKQILTETKAIRTLGIVMGVFIVCWLPYFITYVAIPSCGDCEVSFETQSVITWLGYVNSSLNPIIYAFWNKDFQNAFRRVLCCSHSYSIESDVTMDEMSTASRSVQRLDRYQISFNMTPVMSRTPSASAETSPWPNMEAPKLGMPSISDHSPTNVHTRNSAMSRHSSVTFSDAT